MEGSSCSGQVLVEAAVAIVLVMTLIFSAIELTQVAILEVDKYHIVKKDRK